MNGTKIILTRCQIFHLKCTNFNFGSGQLTVDLGEGKGKRRGTDKEEGRGREG